MTSSPAASAPIPVPGTHPTELLQSIRERRWADVVERCRTDPHEVGSAPRLRNERGYTALHALVAYNQSVPGEELVPAVEAVLGAADEIDYGAEYRLGGNEGGEADEAKVNTNEIAEGEGGSEDAAKRMPGSWRLLLDQENKVRWSPLHLTCVQGGITFNKLHVIKSLLRIDGSEPSEEVRKYQQRVLALLDRQDRNVLHHILTSLVPSSQAPADVRFFIVSAPALLFQKDTNGKTPITYVAERLAAKHGTMKRHYMERHGRDDDEGDRKNYAMLRLLVRAMERETRGWGQVEKEEDRLVIIAPSGKLGLTLLTREPPAPPGPAFVTDIREDSPLKEVVRLGDKVVAVDGEDVTKMTSVEVTKLLASKSELAERKIAVLREVGTQTSAAQTKNVLQCACLVPRDFCPPDGSLLAYLSSEKASKLETNVRDDGADVNMVAEADEEGNRALHVFLANRSYAAGDDSERPDGAAAARPRRRDVEAAEDAVQSNAEYRAIKAMLDSDPEATSVRNDAGRIPLKIAMRCGRRQAVALLVLADPQSVLLDDGKDDVKLFAHVLASISVPHFCLAGKAADGNGDGNDGGDGELARMHQKCLTTIYNLIRGHPDGVAFGGPESGTKESTPKKKKKWYNRLNPFL